MEKEVFLKDDFEFAKKDEKIHDLKFDTKPIGYFKDAWIRFRKSKAAVFGAIVILLVVLYAIITPLTNAHSASYYDGTYKNMVPWSKTLSSLHIADGTYSKELNQKGYLNLLAIGIAAEDKDGKTLDIEKGKQSAFNPVKEIKNVYESDGLTYYTARVQQYYEIGFSYVSLTKTEYEEILRFQEEKNIQIVYPMIDRSKLENNSLIQANANYWYSTKNGYPIDANGKKITDEKNLNSLQKAYLLDEEGNPCFFTIGGSAGDQYTIRVLYYNYYLYKYDMVEPYFLMGTDSQGYDIAARLASGIGLSLLLSISTFAVNFLIGAIYGAIEGYYGGALDLVMERVSDILSNIPFIVLASIVNATLISTGKMDTFGALVFAFVLTGWIGPAYRVRTQFYRFKNQEYVLAARTLGASDVRIMWKHIFPNTLGTIVTSSVLTIPSTIFSESMLSYLGIINFNSKGITSLGTMLSNGQPYLHNFPHIILPPAIVLSLLMISFNLFGNGLRDAFNPSLRGSED
ncbi:MAG TPA: hypothetical protein DCZ41_01770 [Firmicutes bacterium]|nr:hypothetical protein [Bacillota bacterium]